MSFPARGRCRRRAGFVAQHPREEAASAPIGHTASMWVTAWRALGVRSGVLACPGHCADSGRARQSRGRQCRGALDPGLRPCGLLPSLVLAGHPALQGLGTVALGVSGCPGRLGLRGTGLGVPRARPREPRGQRAGLPASSLALSLSASSDTRSASTDSPAWTRSSWPSSTARYAGRRPHRWPRPGRSGAGFFLPDRRTLPRRPQGAPGAALKCLRISFCVMRAR